MAKIIDNLKQFTQDLVDLILDNSKKDQQKMGMLFSNAHAAYDAPKKLWIIGRLYNYTRQRSQEFDKAEQELSHFPGALFRLQILLKFISEGNWTTTSGNTQLLTQLIHAVPGYDKETDTYLYETLFDPLKRLLSAQIPWEIKKQQDIIEADKASQNERDRNHEKKEKEQDQVALFVKEDEAKAFALKNPQHYAVFFIKNQLKWSMAWCDATGRKELLPANKELQALLSNQPIALGFDEKMRAKIKTQCRVMLEEFLGKITLLLNPAPEGLNGLVSTFVVGEKEKSITWYDSLGRTHALDLKKYPLIDQALKTLDLTQQSNALFFRSLLLRVSTRHAVDSTKQSSLLRLMQQQFNCELLLVNTLAECTMPRVGAYILTRDYTHEQTPWVLYRWEKGAVQKINTHTWLEYNNMLEGFDHCLPRDINASDKDQLRTLISNRSKCSLTTSMADPVKPISKINLAGFTALEKCLGSRLAMGPILSKDEDTATQKEAIADKKKKLTSRFSAIATLFGASPRIERDADTAPVVSMPEISDEGMAPPPPPPPPPPETPTMTI